MDEGHRKRRIDDYVETKLWGSGGVERMLVFIIIKGIQEFRAKKPLK